ncbi:MAG: phage tail protein [Clostridiales bacterium]|nr:phage tail protein [Clostridiales bacterium]
MVNIELTQEQIEHVNKVLYQIPDGTKKAVTNALNRGLTKARTVSTREIKKRYDISTQNLRTEQNITLRQAAPSDSEISGEIKFSGKKIPMYRFHPNPAVRKYLNRYVNGHSGWRVTGKVKAADVRGVYKSGDKWFIATMDSGHTGIFKREEGKTTSSGKTKLKEIYGFSVADMLDYPEARDSILTQAQETINDRLDQEIYRLLNGYGG